MNLTKKYINIIQQFNYILLCIIFNYKNKFIILQFYQLKKLK